MNFSNRPLIYLIRIIGALLLSLLLSLASGCSAIKLGYGNAPTLAYWWLDGYADFTSAQAEPVKESLRELHTWHRQQALPAYIETTRKLQLLAPSNVNQEQLCGIWGDVQGHIQQLERAAVSGLSLISTTFQPEQMRYLRAKFDKRNQTWREDWLDASPKARLDRRLKQSVERAEMFYENLSDAQRNLLKSHLERSSFDAQLTYTEALRRQQDIVQLLQKHSAQAGTRTPSQQTEIFALLERMRRSPEPTYRALQEKLITENCEMFSALHNSASAAQRAYLLEKLRDYESDFRTLMAQPAS